MPPERAQIRMVPRPSGGLAPACPVAGAERQEPDASSERFERLYAEHFEFVWRSLRLLGVEESALADVTQDVFGTVARQLSSFEGRSSLRTWVFGIVENTAANHRRRRARKLDRLQPLDEEHPAGDPSPHARAEGKEAADLIVRFCAELEDGRRAVFVLGLLEGVPAAEIAASLGLPVNTVYTRMHALRQALKQRLEEREVEQ